MTRAPKRIISITLSLLIALYGSVAQSQPASAAVLGADFTITVSDLQFILQQIRIAESHRAIEATSPVVTPSTNVLTAGRVLADPQAPATTGNTAGRPQTINISAASTRVLSPLLPEGLRQVDGRNNNLTANGFSSWMGWGYITPNPLAKSAWGAADTSFPRLVPPEFKTVNGKSYSDRTGDVTDAAPRLISNLISDESEANPAARAAANCTLRSLSLPNPCAPSNTDGASLFIANRATNGVAAPYNGMFALFGQFFDHGLDLVAKSSTTSVKIPLAASDPLHETCVNLTNRGCVAEISMGRTVLDPNDPTTAGTNTTTPWIDQNQTYTSHPSHQVFLREYKCANESSASINPNLKCTSANRPVATGKLFDGVDGNIGNWAEVKLQAANKLGIQLVDMDIYEVPLLLTDEYGRFMRSSTGFPQMVIGNSGTTALVRVGNPAAPVATEVGTPAAAFGTGHAFLNDIAHFAAPAAGLLPTNVGGVVSHMTNGMPDTGYYDNDLLNAHFITGDGRGNENIGLTAVHTIFHAEHNRLWSDIQNVINSATTGSTGLSAATLANFKNAWRTSSITPTAPNPEWNGERLFHASKLITEMEYQHLVFGEFARKVQPLIKPFVAYDPTIRPDISGEFAHAVYRYGHSQLNETVDRTSAGGTANDMKVPLLYAFLNPTEFNQPHDYYTNPGSPSTIGSKLTGAQAAGSIVRGMSRQTGNEIDEFVTGALRNSLLGLPLDLATLNIARGRDAGIPSLNSFRTTLKRQTGITSLAPYASWAEFGQGLRHPESLVNFVAAYGDAPALGLDPTDTNTYIQKREAAQTVVDCFEANHATLPDSACVTFMLGNSGLNDVDMWVGGLAEKNTQAGTMLGSTFDYVFKKQLEKLQESDRFYYLGRLAGLNLTVQVETNFFSDIIMRNTDVTSITTDAFAVPTYAVDMAATAPSYIKVLGDGTWMYTGTGHVLWNGTSASNKVLSDRGDDSIYGADGNDWLRGGDGNDFVQGGAGNDVIEDSSGANILIGGNGNDYMSGSGTDAYNGNGGDDFISGGTFPVVGLAGIGNDWVRGGSDNDILSGDDGNDWLEGGEGGDLVDGDVVGPAGVTLAFPGNDVLIGNSGNDLISGFDGADIYVSGDGTDLNTGGLGFDWATYYNDGQVGGVNEDLSNFAPAPGLVLANLADQFQEIEGLSGGSDNDILSGSSLTTLGGTASNGLSATDCALITGLAALLPTATCAWNAGDILIGGAGSDEITGRNGADLIDGNASLQTWISIPLSWGIANEALDVAVPAGRAYVASMSAVRDYVASHLIASNVMADLQIVRVIAQAPFVQGENDIAVYQAPRANYTIVLNANGTITVTDPRNGGGTTIDGVDTLRNIETLRFTDGDLLVSSLPPSAPVLVAGGAVGGVGTIAVTWAAPTVAGGAPLATYTARAWTSNLRTGTPAGTCTTADATIRTCTITPIGAGAYFVDVIATTTTRINSAPSAIVAVSPTVTAAIPASITPGTQTINATQNVSIAATSAFNTTGFTGTVTYSYTGGTLPTGINFDTTTGIFSGTPSTLLTQTRFTVTASDQTRTASANVNITVSAPGAASITPITSSTQTVNAVVGSLITPTSAFTETNLSGAVTYSLVSGTWPAGLSFNSSTGVVSGTPTATQASTTYTIRATDSLGATADSTVSITIGTTPTPPPSGALSAPTGVTVRAGAAGTAVITWNAVSGASRYTAQAFSSNTSTKIIRECSVTATANGSSFTCTIPRLQSRLTYYVEVVARNVSGAISTPSRIPVTVL